MKMIRIRGTGELFCYAEMLAQREDVDVVEVDDKGSETPVEVVREVAEAAPGTQVSKPKRERAPAPVVSVVKEGENQKSEAE